MAQGDVVIMNFEPVFDAKPRLIGTVVAVPQGGTSTVLWENGKQSTVPDALLRRINAPSNQRLNFVGKWAQLEDWDPNLVGGAVPALTGQLPKSPAASGIIRQMFDAEDIGGGADAAYAVLEALDGKAALVVYQDHTASDLSQMRVEAGRRRVQE